MCYVFVCLVSSIGEIVEHLWLCSRNFGQNSPEKNIYIFLDSAPVLWNSGKSFQFSHKENE